MSGFFEYKFKAISGIFAPYEKIPYTAEMPIETAFTCRLEDPIGILWDVGITANEDFTVSASVGVIQYMLVEMECVGTVYSLIEDDVRGLDINVEERHDFKVEVYAQVNNRIITDAFIPLDETFAIRASRHAGLDTEANITADESLTVSMACETVYAVQEISIVGTCTMTAMFTHVTAINTTVDCVFTESVSASLWLYSPTIMGASVAGALELTANARLRDCARLSHYDGSRLSDLSGRTLKELYIEQI